MFRRQNGGILKFSLGSLEQMLVFIQDNPPKWEAGGVLLGRFIKESDDIVVDRATVPMPGDRRSRFGFFRNAEPHQAAIDEAWINSDHTCNYLGGWHTHLEACPAPSRRDSRDWKRALKREVFDSKSIFFAILGTETLRVWEGLRETEEISELLPLDQYGDDDVIKHRIQQD